MCINSWQKLIYFRINVILRVKMELFNRTNLDLGSLGWRSIQPIVKGAFNIIGDDNCEPAWGEKEFDFVNQFKDCILRRESSMLWWSKFMLNTSLRNNLWTAILVHYQYNLAEILDDSYSTNSNTLEKFVIEYIPKRVSWKGIRILCVTILSVYCWFYLKQMPFRFLDI